jgi:hypothetical protein
MIEINLTKLEKKKVWVKDPSKKGGGYWSHRKVGRKDEPVPLLPGYENMTPYYDFENYEEIDDYLIKQKDEDGWLPAYENMIVLIGGKAHYFVAETWYPDCLESRDYDIDTNPTNIKSSFKEIAEFETGLSNLDHAKYIPDAKMAEYGVSYVTKEVPPGHESEFSDSYFE